MARLSPVQVDGDLINGWALWDTDTHERTMLHGRKVPVYHRRDDAEMMADSINEERGF
jgi:hypothetical protein